MGWGTWIFFAGCLMLSAVWAYFFLPETVSPSSRSYDFYQLLMIYLLAQQKGLRLDEMDALFGFTGEEKSGILHPDSVHDPQARKLQRPSHEEEISTKKLEEV